MDSPHSQAAHDAKSADTRRRLGLALVLTLSFAGVEAVGGLVSGSLALLADAGHMLGDATALGLSWLATWLAARQTSHRHTYGYRRAEFLAAFVNAMGLVALAVWIVIEAVERIGDPQPVLSSIMLWVALAGLAVNLLALRLLHSHAHASLNIRSAVWHVLGDVLGSVGAVVGAVVIGLTGWTPIDPLLSMGIAMLIGIAGGRILFDSGTLLMDRAPAEVDTSEVRAFLAEHPSVEGICDLHIWGVSSREVLLTAHLVVAPDLDRDRLLNALLPELQRRFSLAHMTVQLESEPHASCPSAW